MFECTVVWQVRRLRSTPSFALTVMAQRVKTLTEFRTMSVAPYPIMCLRDSKWVTLQTDELLPGDVVSVGKCARSISRVWYLTVIPPARLQSETVVPADILLVHGTCIVNEAMLSGESTPLLKESIQLLDTSDKVDVDGAHKNEVLFSGTKVLQASPTSEYLRLTSTPSHAVVRPRTDLGRNSRWWMSRHRVAHWLWYSAGATGSDNDLLH